MLLGGIIPAYAGSTREDLLDYRTKLGSSPHTRGARDGSGVVLDAERIIPAYAGSTLSRCTRNFKILDHPRIRGEHARPRARPGAGPGSSPHTRGALEPRPARPSRRRIIPAYAGSTTLPRRQGSPAPDHPRIRGEHRRLGLPTGYGDGSSPHTRGARSVLRVAHFSIRIIPAYAGSTTP